ncbi:MAG: hypothetical protein SWZ49_18250 [Cyanobacteriota bacterium]|nr:hypothetical protein [Cyanobacteriota bacterium]
MASASTSPINTSVREDRTILVNGQPFFPFGIYHDSIDSPDWSTTNAKRLNDLKQIIAAGFNTIHPQIGGNFDADITFLDEANRNGVYVLPNFSYARRLEIVDSYKSHPAILGWNIADDVDVPANGFSVGGVLDWKSNIKSTDPSRITFVSSVLPGRMESFINTADVMGFQSYRIDNDPAVLKPLRENYYFLLAATEAGRRNNKPIIASLQTFPWVNQPPTSRQLRNMTYGALINDVKGILYYSYFYEGWELSQNSDLWNELKSLVSEFKRLEPVLLEGNWKRLNSGVDDLFAAEWTYQGSVYVVAINTSPTNAIEASIPIPEPVTGSIETVFSNRPSGMYLNEGKLTGSIGSEDVHVYRLPL